MTPATFNATILAPGLAFLHDHAPAISQGRDARVLMLAIAGQESAWRYRSQVPIAYAKGFWQFERGGAVHGVLTHPASALVARQLCAAVGVSFNETSVWNYLAFPRGDRLAACLARLLLFTDAAPLPDADDDDATYDCYERNWRPGKAKPDAWPANIEAARRAVEGP